MLPPSALLIAPPPLAVVLRIASADAVALHARLARLHAALAVDHEVVLVGAGDPDDVAPVLRRLAAADPRHRVLLHTRHRPPVDTLFAGVAHARSPWVAALADADMPDEGETVAELWRHAATAAAPTCVHAGAGQPVLFARSGFLALAPIAQMRAYLPELFARAGADVRAIGGGGRPTPSATGFVHWLRRTRVALLCRMAAFGTTARA